MKLFCHISEFRDAGWKILPVTLLLADEVSLWGPMAPQIDDAGGPLSSGDLIELFQERGAPRITVMGREEWIQEESFRNTYATQHFGDARWVNGFDDIIRSAGLQELQRNTPWPDRRVRICGKIDEAEGYPWADHVLASEAAEDRTRVATATHRWKGRALPPGLLEKTSEMTESEAVRLILRDVKNHCDAIRDSGCDYPLEPASGSDLFPAIGREDFPVQPIGRNTPAPDRLREIVGTLGQIAKPRTGEEWKKLIADSDRNALREELGALAESDVPVAALLEAQIATGHTEKTWTEALTAYSRMDLAWTGMGLAMAAATFFLLNSPPLGLGISLFSAVGRPLAGIAEKTSKIGSTRYGGPQLPMVLAFGATTPTYQQVRQICEQLRRL